MTRRFDLRNVNPPEKPLLSEPSPSTRNAKVTRLKPYFNLVEATQTATLPNSSHSHKMSRRPDLRKGNPLKEPWVCEPYPTRNEMTKRLKPYLMNEQLDETPMNINLDKTLVLIEANAWIASLIMSSDAGVTCQLFLTLLADDFETLQKMYIVIPDHFTKVRLVFHESPFRLSFEEMADIKNNFSKQERNSMIKEIRKVEYSIYQILSGLNCELNDNGTEQVKEYFLAALVGFKTVLDYKMLFNRNYCLEALIGITCLQGIALCIAKVYGMEAQVYVNLPPQPSVAQTIWNIAMKARFTLIQLRPVRSVLEELDYNFGAQEFIVTPTELILFAGHAGTRMRLVERCMRHLQWAPSRSSPRLLCLKDAIYFGVEETDEVIKKHGYPKRKKEKDFWDNLRIHFEQE